MQTCICCIYGCAYAHVYIMCIYICMFSLHTHACMSIHIPSVYIEVYMYAYILCIYTCMHIPVSCGYTSMYMYENIVHMHVHIHVYVISSNDGLGLNFL